MIIVRNLSSKMKLVNTNGETRRRQHFVRNQTYSAASSAVGRCRESRTILEDNLNNK